MWEAFLGFFYPDAIIDNVPEEEMLIPIIESNVDTVRLGVGRD